MDAYIIMIAIYENEICCATKLPLLLMLKAGRLLETTLVDVFPLGISLVLSHNLVTFRPKCH